MPPNLDIRAMGSKIRPMPVHPAALRALDIYLELAPCINSPTGARPVGWPSILGAAPT